jgi:CheY-like chemotaxis protein
MARAKILVVDDTPSNVKVLSTLLALNGYDVATATNGQEALEQVAAEKPDLMLLDVVMPVMDGYETCRRLRQRYSIAELPVIMVTASAPQDRDKAVQAGANEVTMKPVDQDALLALIRSLLAPEPPAA